MAARTSTCTKRFKRSIVILCVTIGSFLVFTYVRRRHETVVRGGDTLQRNAGGLQPVYEGDVEDQRPTDDQLYEGIKVLDVNGGNAVELVQEFNVSPKTADVVNLGEPMTQAQSMARSPQPLSIVPLEQASLKTTQGERMESQNVQTVQDSNQDSNNTITKKEIPLQHQHHLDSTPEVIQKEMQRCALSLGVSSDILSNSTDTLDKISTKASNFLQTLSSIVPRTFLTNYKNFCFYSNVKITDDTMKMLQLSLRLPTHQSTSISETVHEIFNGNTNTLLCLPHFFIAGFPKCGTTTVDNALRQHAGIANPLVKEPHWWGRLGNLDDPNPDYNWLVVMSYIVNFHTAAQQSFMSPQHITYDGSQCTLWDSNFFVDSQEYCAMPVVLSRVLPHAKFIVIMRNPVSRLISHYLWSCSYRFGSLSKWPANIRDNPTEHFHKEVVKGITYFNDCLKTLSVYECTNILRHLDKDVGCGGVGFRMSISLYGVHLSKWMQIYPKEQFLFLRMEDMSDPVYFMSNITTFLGLSQVTPALATQLLSRKANAQKLSTKEEIVMREDTRKLLEDFYRPYNTKLAGLVGDWRFLWQDS